MCAEACAPCAARFARYCRTAGWLYSAIFRDPARISGSPSFARYRAHEVAPGPAVQGEAALGDYVRQFASTVHHPVSTCRMGPGSDCVVDAELRVRGVGALRVADASVFPSIVGGNTNAAVVMIAEKASDMILGRPAPRPLDLTCASTRIAESSAA